MELSNTVEVDAPIAEVWAAVQDLERLAPCLPGAQLTEVDGEDYRGMVKIKVGPITAQYRGVARFLECDDSSQRVVLRAEGRDSRGAGNASANVTATLTALSETSTRAVVETDLTITGKVAQFGRGAIADVSGALMGQFASNLETMLEAEKAGDTAQAAGDESGVRSVSSVEPEALDLLAMVRPSIGQRVAAAAAVLIGLLALKRLFGRSGG